MTTYPGLSREAVTLIHLYESYGWTFGYGFIIDVEPL